MDCLACIESQAYDALANEAFRKKNVALINESYAEYKAMLQEELKATEKRAEKRKK